MTRLICLLAILLLAMPLEAQEAPDLAVVPAEETLDVPVLEASPEPLDLFARDTYRIDPLVCPFKADIDYKPGEIECFLLEVPENREDPDSRMIELHVVKLHSRWGREGWERDLEDDHDRHAEGLADGKRDDPVVYLTGGPGAAVTYYVNRFKDHTLLDHRDLYILEQRGIGYSDNFCLFYGTRKPAIGSVDTYEEYQEAARQRRAECARNATAAGVDLTGYNTIENARDVKAMRRALGYEQWNVWGISYGSILGQAYVKEDPEGILAVALDAIMPLDIQGSEEHWRVINWYMRDLEKLQEICQSQPACAETYPDIPGRVREAAASVIDNPITVEVKDTEVTPSGKVTVFHDLAALLPFAMFYEQANYPGLPGVIYAWADAVERRDEAVFKAIANAVADTDEGLFGASEGMRVAILCTDGDFEAQARASKRDMQDYPVLGKVMGSPESVDADTALCVEMGMPMRPKAQYAPTQTDLPSLIIEGDMDPITPPPNAHAIMPGFSNGTYVEFPYAGHGPSRSVKCAGHLLNKFYDNPGAEPDLSCLEEMTQPEMWAPMYVISAPLKLGALFMDEPKKLVTPAAWGGLSILTSLIAFLLLTLAPVGRWMDNHRAAFTGRARSLAWLAAASSTMSLVIFGAAAAATAEASEMLLAFGLVPWARWAGWLAILAAIIGVVSLLTTLRERRAHKIPVTTLLGFVLTGLAAVGYGSFVVFWGLGPF